MIKSVKTKVRIEQRAKGKKLFDRSTKWGKQCYREWLRGIDIRQNIMSQMDVNACKRFMERLGGDCRWMS